MSLADGGRFRHDRNRAEADIESLRGDLQYARGDWRLRVRYDVEVEDALRRDRFDLVLTVLERGCPLLDRRGRPVRFVVPLDRPTKIGREAITFRRELNLRLPDGSFHNPKRLRLVARVVRADNGRVLDKEGESIKFRRGNRWSRIGRRVASGPRWFLR